MLTGGTVGIKMRIPVDFGEVAGTMPDEDRTKREEAVRDDVPSRGRQSGWNEPADEDPQPTRRRRSGLADMLWGDDERPMVGTPHSNG